MATWVIADRNDHCQRGLFVLPGVYSGVLGYLSATGSASFNVVIRTAVIGPNGAVLYAWQAGVYYGISPLTVFVWQLVVGVQTPASAVVELWWPIPT
jgi:hypothetical protein